jgi:hypothetical protein
MPTGPYHPTDPTKLAQWRSRLAPQEHFARYGRKVKCDGCGQLQWTDASNHRAGIRIREMPCIKVRGCAGRLRTLRWWAQHPEAKPSGHVQDDLFD